MAHATNRYLNPAPQHVEYLDFARLDSGFRVNFFKIKLEALDATPATAVTRAKQAVQNGIQRLENIAKDTTTTADVKNEQAKTVYKAIEKEVSGAVKTIKGYSEQQAEAAKDRAFAVLEPDAGKLPVYSEIRAHANSRRKDADWPAELTELMKTNIDVARAVNAGPGFLSGVNDERHQSLVLNALEAFAPDDLAQMNQAVAVGKETEVMQAGLSKLKTAFYNSAQADRATNSRVDMNAPLVTEAAE